MFTAAVGELQLGDGNCPVELQPLALQLTPVIAEPCLVLFYPCWGDCFANLTAGQDHGKAGPHLFD
jgi:hypothetical protein